MITENQQNPAVTESRDQDGTGVTTPVPLVERSQSVQDAVKVLYIGGQGRSGSTLLGRLMGEVDGCFNAGEIVYIWRPFLQNRLCGCGQPFHECEFWTEVIREGFGSKENIDSDRILKTKHSLERIRTVHHLLNPFKTPAQQKGIQEYVDFLGALYGAIKKVSGCKVIVDGSKAPLYTYFVRQVPNIDLRVFHLVRDSRAVAYSWQRKKLNPAVHWKEMHYGTVNPVHAALEWAAQNELMSMLGRQNKRYVSMRYEDLVEDPTAALTKICELLDEPTPNLDFLKQSPIQLNVHHTVNGNPDRFKQTIEIRSDTEWKEKMKPSHRAIVTSLTYPLLLKYGYKP